MVEGRAGSRSRTTLAPSPRRRSRAGRRARRCVRSSEPRATGARPRNFAGAGRAANVLGDAYATTFGARNPRRAQTPRARQRCPIGSRRRCLRRPRTTTRPRWCAPSRAATWTTSATRSRACPRWRPGVVNAKIGRGTPPASLLQAKRRRRRETPPRARREPQRGRYQGPHVSARRVRPTARTRPATSPSRT